MSDSFVETLPGVLTGQQIRARIASSAPLLRDWTDLDAQVQPNGFDLTLAEVHAYRGGGVIGISNADRVLPEIDLIAPAADGFVHLDPGAYHIVYREIVRLPADLMAFGRPRSSLTRSGVTIHTAVWDAGYEGRSTSLLSVLNPAGFDVQIGARVMQLVFVGLSTNAERLYSGTYQGENIRPQ